MSTLDALLKHLVTEFASDFAGWLLDDDVRAADPLTVELPATAIVADAVFRVVLSDGRIAILHIEFQGRRSHRPMPERMLDYLTRLARQVAAPIRSVVLYVEPGAGAEDDGRHKVLGPAGEVCYPWPDWHGFRIQEQHFPKSLRKYVLSLTSGNRRKCCGSFWRCCKMRRLRR